MRFHHTEVTHHAFQEFGNSSNGMKAPDLLKTNLCVSLQIVHCNEHGILTLNKSSQPISLIRMLTISFSTPACTSL